MPDHEHFLKIFEKLDEIGKDVSEIKVMDAVQNEQLATHMKRSDLLEKRIEQVDEHVKGIWKDALKWIASIAGLAAVIKGLFLG